MPDIILDLLHFLWKLALEYHKPVIEGVLLFFLWLLLRREREKLETVMESMQERIATLGELVKAVQETVEDTPVAQAPVPIGPAQAQIRVDPGAHWTRIREKWANIRERIELTIAQISNKNVRKKYSNIARYSYTSIIQTLLGDSKYSRISPRTAANLLNMNAAFLGFRRRPNAITDVELSQFLAWYRMVDEELPRLPEEDATHSVEPEPN